MELSKDIEEILSDDYEEGEILDEDSIYDEVSSLEEFSGGEFSNQDKNDIENNSVELRSEKKVKQHTKHHRKKDHKCKEDSICRKERKGKHCYARIRKDKQASALKIKTLDVPQTNNEKHSPKKLEVTSVVKRVSQRSRQGSPNNNSNNNLRQDHSKQHRHTHKDYHEKENRHSNKKHWCNNEKLSRSKVNNSEKPTHKSKLKEYGKTKFPNSSVLGPFHSDLDSNVMNEQETNQPFSKTSLLKRLVGSGNVGVKTLKETDSLGINVQPCNVENTKSIGSSSLDSSSPSVETSGCTRLISVAKEKVSVPEKSHDDFASPLITSEVPSNKKVEVKWMRSIKEDKDELTLRVEALRSAWVKKFNERKKRGLLQQKKSEYIDDSLVDFVLENEAEKSIVNPTFTEDLSIESSNLTSGDIESNGSRGVKFSVSDLSGDILKTEDMIIVKHDKNNDNPIICEPALQIVTTSDITNSSVTDSSVFIASSSTLFSTPQCTEKNINLPDKTIDCKQNVHSSSSPKQVVKHLVEKNVFPKDSNKSRYSSNHSKITNDFSLYKSVTPKTLKGRRSLSRSVSRSDRKNIAKLRKKNRRKAKRDSRKNITNTLEQDDERLLREQALLSLKSKTSRLSSQQVDGNIETTDVPISNVASTNGKMEMNSNTGNSLLLDNHPKPKEILSVCESEGTGATSSDNWEDDLDEDILRAQLLSSLTKQVNERSTIVAQAMNVFIPNSNIEFNSNLRTQNVKKAIMRKHDRRKLKSINKKLWKQNINTLEKKIKLDEAKISVTQYRKGNVFIKNDITVQVPLNGPSTIVPPIPQVPKLIISLNDSDSSSDMEVINDENPHASHETSSNNLPSDIEANIDLLLLEAKKNTQLENESVHPTDSLSPKSDPCANIEFEARKKVQESAVDDASKKIESFGSLLPNVSQTSQVTDNKPKTQQSTSSSSTFGSCNASATPQALKHLPAWQQEEYRRLKKKIAEKEKVLQVTRAKVVEPMKEAVNAGAASASQTSNEACSLPEQNLQKPNTGLAESAGGALNVLRTEDRCCSNVPNDKEKCNIFSDQDNRHINKNLKNHINYSSDESNAEKKNYTTLASCSVLEEINVMNDIVNEFDKNSNEYSDLKTKWARLKKVLKITESKMSMKRKKLLQVRDKIQEKDRCISSKITSIAMTPVAANEKNKAPSRDMELIKLKYKEVSLRAQFLFHDFSTEIKSWDDDNKKISLKEPQSNPLKRGSPKMSPISISRKRTPLNGDKLLENTKEMTEPPTKRSFSAKEREREEWDPNTPVCHFDLNGICKDEECKYQHFKTV